MSPRHLIPVARPLSISIPVKIVLLTLLLLALCTSSASAAWKSVPLGGGGYTNVIRVNQFNKNYVLMGTDVGGLHYSSDGGLHWVTRARAVCSHADRVASVVWHPSLPGVAYALVGDGVAGTGCLMYTTDYGYSWKLGSATPTGEGNNTTKLDAGLPSPHPRSVGTLIAVDQPHGVMYVGTFRDGLMRAPVSTTGVPGTFSTIALAPVSGKYHYIRSIAIDDLDATKVYVSQHTGSLSTGTAKTVRISSANATPVVADLTAGPSNGEELSVLDGNLYAVANDAAAVGSGVFRLAAARTASVSTAWRKLTLTGAPSEWYSVSASKYNGVTTLWVTGDTSWRPTTSVAYKPMWKGTSSDGFATNGTWVALPELTTDTPNDIGGPGSVQAPDAWWALQAGTYGWLGKDSGYTVSDVSTSSGDPNFLLLAGQLGPWRSTNGGKTWYPVPNGDNILCNQRIAADPKGAGRAAIGNIDWEGFYTGDSFTSGSRLKPTSSSSHDGWSVAWDTGTTTSALYMGVGLRDTNAGGEIWSTATPNTNSGWTQLGSWANGRPVGLAVVRDPAAVGTPIALAVIQGDGMYRKSGTGAWTKASGFTTSGSDWPQRVTFAWRAGFHKVYVYDRTSGLWRSNDYGKSWVKIDSTTGSSNSAGYIAALPASENEVVFSSAAGVQLLTNAGTAAAGAATGVALGLPSGSAGAIAVSNSNKLYAANKTSRIYSVQLTTAGKSGSWVDVSDDLWTNMYDAPGELSVDANGSVYAVTSGGATVLPGG